MSCDVGKATEGLENELWCRWRDVKVGEWAELRVIIIAELILQPFCHFTYVTAHSPTLPSLYLRHRSFSNPSVASTTSQLILQSFFRFSYVTISSLNSPGEPPVPNCPDLAGPRSRPYISRKKNQLYSLGSKPGPLVWQSDMLSTIPTRWIAKHRYIFSHLIWIGFH